jgi:PAS domain S-box-containing protein
MAQTADVGIVRTIPKTGITERASFLESILESSTEYSIVAYDLHGTILAWNEGARRIYGYEPEDVIGKAKSFILHDPTDVASGYAQRLLDETCTLGKWSGELKRVRRNGVRFSAFVTITLRRDVAGNPVGFTMISRDLTEARHLQSELKESQEYNPGLIESNIDALMTTDPLGIISDVNRRMCEMTGYLRGQLIGSPFKNFFSDPQRAEDGIRKVLADDRVTNYELVMRSRSGTETAVSYNATTFRGTDGRLKGVFAAAREITHRKGLEVDLLQAQNYTRGLIEASVDALLTVDPNGVITDVNEQTAKLTGYNRKQLIGSPFVDLFTEPERASAGVRQTFDNGVVTNYELVLRARSGRKLPVSFNAAVFRDAGGAVAGILAAARDITQQKQIEQTMREQQTYTRSLIESNIDALMTTDTLGIITDVNRQMCAVTGRPRQELIGTPFKNYFTDPHRAEDGIRTVLAEDRVTDYELTIRAKNGKETVVSYNATTFRGADGHLRGVLAAARDITAQKQLEEQIRRQNRELTEATAFLNNVLESSTEYSIIAKDLNGNILAWNEGARRNYGYTPEEMVSKQNSRVLHTPEDVASGRVQELLETALRTGKAEGTFERVRKDGERFTASVAVTLRRGANGSPIGFVLISKDITEQKQLEEQLRRKNEELEEQNRRVQEANRLKSEFLANMSHELRTPLNAIIGFSEMMYDSKAGPVTNAQHEYLGDILASGRHLLQLINDILDLAKVEAGRMDFYPEPVDLAQIVAEVRDILRSLAVDKGIEIATEVDPSLTSVVIDPAKLKQVLYNYLSNALKFTADRGRVTVRMTPADFDEFMLEVEDTGIGISSEDQGRLFVEFQQLDASSAKKYQGTGLGLALTKRIVEAQGGELGMRSVPGVGSTFWARLKRRHSGRTPLLEPAAKVPVVNGDLPRVLVIEDNASDRNWLAETLSEGGYDPVCAANGGEALRHLATARFDAITLDILLPDTTAPQLMRAIRDDGLNANTPVIAVTITERRPIQAFSVHDWLVKPVKRDRLLKSLHNASPGHVAIESSVLVVDDDPASLKLAARALEANGYRALCADNGADGLRAVETECPIAIVLDLIMDEMDGFEFLRRLRLGSGRNIPVIVWSGKALTNADRALLLRTANKIVPKGDGATEMLLGELATYAAAPAQN